MTDFTTRVLRKLIELRTELEGYHEELHGEDYGSPSLNAMIDEAATICGCNYLFAVKKSLFDTAVAAGTMVTDDPRFMNMAVEMLEPIPVPEEKRLMVIKLHGKGRKAVIDLFTTEFGVPFEAMHEVVTP